MIFLVLEFARHFLPFPLPFLWNGGVSYIYMQYENKIYN